MISKPPWRLRVFVVDEELLFASCLTLFLREDGHDARSFADPLEALLAAHVAPPAILVSDVALKLIAGIHLATWIREDFPACHVLLFSKDVETNSLLASASPAGNEISLVPAPVHLLALMERIRSLIQDVHPHRRRMRPQTPPITKRH